MATTVEGLIQDALFTRVKGLSFIPALPVAWPDTSFTPPSGGTPKKPLPYLRVTHVPNINRRLFVGSDAPHQRLGILQVGVFTPVNGGPEAATEIAGRVAAWFPADLRMTSGGIAVSVERAPDVRQGLPEEAYWHTPVIIRYQAFA